MVGDAPLDLIDANRPSCFLLQDIFEEVFDFFRGRRMAAQRSVRSHAHQRALQAPNVGADPFGEKLENGRINLYRQGLRFLSEDSQSGLDIRWLQFCRETPLK